MSVLIKDMEKPKSCYAVIDGESEYCPFVNPDDNCVLLLKKGIICEGTWADQYSKCPLAEVPERKKGKWILDENPHDGDCRCSVCLVAIDQMHERNHGLLNALTGGKWWTFYKFCPNCGSYNGGEQE